jgi:hypothetical protein
MAAGGKTMELPKNSHGNLQDGTIMRSNAALPRLSTAPKRYAACAYRILQLPPHEAAAAVINTSLDVL